jgi:hypothetical protein
MKKNKINYLADHGPLAHLPRDIAALSSSYEPTSTMLLQENIRIILDVFDENRNLMDFITDGCDSWNWYTTTQVKIA